MRSLRHRIHLAASRVHKWLALLIGMQLLIWFVSGALMSFLSIDEVRGDHLVDRKTVAAIPATSPIGDPSRLLAGIGTPVEAITLRMLRGKPVAEVTSGGTISLFDAATGTALPPIDAAAASAIARQAWRGGAVAAPVATRVLARDTEYRGALPAWRVAFSDPDVTRVFVAADTGRIVAVRTGTWRLYDFFWGLHIMDWSNHEDFNTPWLLGFAIGGLVFGLAGTVLLVLRWPFRWRRRRPAGS